MNRILLRQCRHDADSRVERRRKISKGPITDVPNDVSAERDKNREREEKNDDDPGE